MKKHLNIIIYGVVQNVSFRIYSKERAGELGLGGFVRNEKDGTVYIEVEGGEAELDEFVQWCRKGPGLAMVEKVEVKEGKIRGYDSFEILLK